MRKIRVVKGLVIILFVIILVTFVPVLASAGQVVWNQSRINAYSDFNGCTDDPNNPNPLQVKNMPINFTSSVVANHQVYVFVHAGNNVSLGGCIATVLPFVNSITDDGGNAYSRIATYAPNSGLLQAVWEIWQSNTAFSASQLVIHMGSGKLAVGAVIYDFNGIVTTEFTGGPTGGVTVNSGDGAFNDTWNNTAQVVLAYGFTSNGVACAGNEPNCIYPATTANSGTGGYNENNLTIACIIPPPGGCAANTNSNNKPGGGDNNSALGGINRIQTARITSIATGSHTFYWLSTSATTMWFFALLLTPQVNPIVTTLAATNLDIDRAQLNGFLNDTGIGPNVLVWFMWGDTVSLGNNTSSQTLTAVGAFSQTLFALLANHTYYFIAHAENAANGNLAANGSMLNFTTVVNKNLFNFVAYGWVFGFIAAIALGLWGAFWIKEKREERGK